ncbi:MAG: hypothetical protein M9899_00430 [Bdellovibrionaceae bacterium]|nr:hypothetical protein [Pseudobdellovibrionaceae bacterium]
MDQPSYWVFKTKVTQNGKTISGYSHITYVNQEKIRIDVFGPLGLIHAASVVYENQNFEALLPLEKRFVFGEASEQTMEMVLKVPLDPAIFYNLIYQTGFENKDWSCTLDESNRVRECENRRAGLNVSWNSPMSRNGGEFEVKHAKGTARFTFNKYRELDQVPNEKFKLNVPNGYKRFKVDSAGISKL